MNRIRLIREERGMSLNGLATRAEVSAPYLLDLERGARGAKPETLERIAAALGVKVEDLMEVYTAPTGDEKTA
ncbi:MAG: helix-turn-helix transcriptional regulator [Lachnospiraceae bacterium]|nr:helix-turn-helix transcriptional regulator [Lachnospiraceae bacterium]